MDHQTASEVMACLPHDRTLFHYYRDRYSIGLLRHLASQFCFGKTDEAPEFLLRERRAATILRRHPRTQFQRLEL